MRRLAGPIVLALLLAGCLGPQASPEAPRLEGSPLAPAVVAPDAPPPDAGLPEAALPETPAADPAEGSAPTPPAPAPGQGSRGPASPSSGSSSSSSSSRPEAPAPSTPSNGSAAAEGPAEADAPPTPPPAGGDAGPGPSTPGSPGPGSGPGGSGGAAPPPDPGALPRLDVGDRWVYRGMDYLGDPYDETLEVVGLGDRYGRPTYVVSGTLDGTPTTIHLSRAGLSPVDTQGFEMELLHFPLRVGDAWTFGWERWQNASTPTNQTVPHRQAFEGDARVDAIESITVPAGTFEAYRLHANLTNSLGQVKATTRMTYWFAPAVKGLVRLETVNNDGQDHWSELVEARLLSSPG